MARVSNTVQTRRRRKKIIKQAKGYFVSKGTLYKTANEQVMRSHAYAYRDRKRRKRDFRKLWIQRINAASKLHNMKYSQLIHGLSLAGVVINRKMLADIAVNEPNHFAEYVKTAQNAIAKASK
ncbi:50S ribosomal protein L20 [Haploplasma modicum]|jgi:large subunit ribosomal protein L20|uniref:50S ribosomal protein L20 n=1 Tax=Haploplasma modicum TaxID=2150 RepID=UPI00214B3C8E|nr:50S ribosomal protein L20 [Haploplasma modicum]MCR1808892.1 50S ribosomal protein L20 [Haploplasma modicum]